MNPCNHSPHQFFKLFLAITAHLFSYIFFQVTQEIFLGFLLSTVHTKRTGAEKTQNEQGTSSRARSQKRKDTYMSEGLRSHCERGPKARLEQFEQQNK